MIGGTPLTEAAIATLDEYLQDRGELTVLRGPSAYRRVPARLLNPEQAPTARTSRYELDPLLRLPREGVAILPDVTLWEGGKMRLDDGRILAESLENPTSPPGSPPPPVPDRFMRQAITVCKQGNANYGHFLFEMLPRLGLNRELLPANVPIVLHRKSRAFAEPLLEAAGFGDHPRRWVSDVPIGIEQLHWPTRNSKAPLLLSPHIVPYLRSLPIATSDRPATRRLYVGRSDAPTRHLVNEDEVWAVLEPLGFEPIAPGHVTFAEQAEVFAEASMVVGICGAALSNMVFMPPGGTVVMLTPSEMAGYLFWDLACHCGHELEILWGPTVELHSDDARRHKHEDFRVDVALLAEAVERPRPPRDEIARAHDIRALPGFEMSVLDEPEVVGPSWWRPPFPVGGDRRPPG